MNMAESIQRKAQIFFLAVLLFVPAMVVGQQVMTVLGPGLSPGPRSVMDVVPRICASLK